MAVTLYLSPVADAAARRSLSPRFIPGYFTPERRRLYLLATPAYYARWFAAGRWRARQAATAAATIGDMRADDDEMRDGG